MYIRKKINISGSTSIQIIQKIDKKEKVLRTVGYSSDPEEIEKLYQQAWEEIYFDGPTIFDQISTEEIQNADNNEMRTVGPDNVFGKLYERIGYQTLENYLLKSLVISRLSYPGSKLKLNKYLKSSGRSPFLVYSIYRSMDKIRNRYKSKVEQISFDFNLSIPHDKPNTAFYNIAPLHFDNILPDELKIPGISKKDKHQYPKIYIGLLTGVNGHPIGYDIFEWKKCEGKNLISKMQRFEKQFNMEHIIVVAHSDSIDKKIISILTENSYQFILGGQLKKESYSIMGSFDTNQLSDGMVIEHHRKDKNRVVIEYQKRRVEENAVNRERSIKRLEKQVKSGILTKSHLNNRGANKYLKVDECSKFVIDYEKYSQDIANDGINEYITNTDFAAKDIIDTYRGLLLIEKAFRMSKTDLKIRTIFHSLRDRIEAHVCISFMAYLIYKEFERLLQINEVGVSVLRATEQINKMYDAIIPDNNGKLISLKSERNQIQKKIEKI